MITLENVTPFGSLGVILESPAIKTLQEFLQKQGKLASGQVTGAMNDATMATIYGLVIENLGVIEKINAVPGTVKDGISAVRSALKTADSGIKSLTGGLVTLKMVLTNFSKAIDLVRLGSDDIATTLTEKRDQVYNAVGKQAATIEKGLKVGLAVAALVSSSDTTTPTTSTGSGSSSFFSQIRPPQLPATFRIATPVKTAGAAAAASAAAASAAAAAQTSAAAAAQAPVLPFVGCVVRYNKTRKKYVIYCRPSGGLGVADANDNCLYGACALGATPGAPAVTPPPPEGMVETAAVDSRADAGGAKDGGEENVPLYKRPWFWASVAGAAAVGAGGVVLWRRKRAPAAGQFAAAYGRRSYGGRGRRTHDARRGRPYYDRY